MTALVVELVNGLCNASPHSMGFDSRRPSRVPLPNVHHRAARLAWAREHRNWSVEDWISRTPEENSSQINGK
ncbi:hypothetical protein TNCV_1928391 [Trichonephila clavipes]|nr:hypothetical protein TNCV_1928391 [Trichonephila clavipes]